MHRNINLLVSAISEDTICQIYSKVATQMRNNDLIQSEKFDFYLSLYYKGDLIKSRTLNSKRQNHILEQEQKRHKDFFASFTKKDKSQDVIVRRLKNDQGTSICCLRIGYLSIIVSNDAVAAVQACASIVAMIYAINKAMLLVKEWGQLHDLKRFFETEEDAYLFKIIKDVEDVMAGRLGGHR